MREIKFRIFTKDTNKMIYADDRGYFESCFLGENGFRQTTDISYLTNKGKGKCHIMQYTGLKDKNGKEIYEGDIFVKLVSYLDLNSIENYSDKVYCVVKFVDGCFKVYQKGWGYHNLKDVINMKEEIFDKWESGIVIGNIYENKEFLEAL